MIYNTRNRNNDTTESQKEKKTCCPMYSKQTYLSVYSWNKMWSLKSLVMLKCESRTSPHVIIKVTARLCPDVLS